MLSISAPTRRHDAGAQDRSERGTAALIAIHDLGLASRFSDRLVLLSAGQVHADGEWTSVLSPAHLEGVYGVTAVVGTANGLPYVIPTKQTP
jgi:iron complex transport system ATP-binding protein